jgi:hypothetical protein
LRPEGALSPFQVASLHQHVDQYSDRTVTLQERGRPASFVEQGPCIGLRGGEVTAPESK